MSKQLKADLLLVFITAVWGSTFTIMKNVLEDIPVYVLLSLRFGIAFVLLLMIFCKRLKFFSKKTFIYGCAIGALLFSGMALQTNGLYYTSASNSAFITGMSVVMVPVISSLFLRKRPDIASTAGVVLACAGLFFLAEGWKLHFNLGDVLTLICAICFAFHIIFIDKFTAGQDAVLLAVIQIGFAALLNTAAWAGTGFESFSFNTEVLLTLLVTGVFGTALAYTGQTIVQGFTSPTHTALIFTTEPVFGAFFAMLIPGSDGQTEKLGVYAAAGCGLILAGMLISEFKIGFGFFTKNR